MSALLDAVKRVCRDKGWHEPIIEPGLKHGVYVTIPTKPAIIGWGKDEDRAFADLTKQLSR